MALIKWAELREEEFEDAVKKSDGLCMIPVGCFEMHGQHLPVRTDVYEAEAIAEAAAELETAVVFPAFEFGAVASLVEWKGAVRLDPHLMLDLLENYCTEIARNGFDKILLVNYHGGNTGFLGHFGNVLSYKYRNCYQNVDNRQLFYTHSLKFLFLYSIPQLPFHYSIEKSTMLCMMLIFLMKHRGFEPRTT